MLAVGADVQETQGGIQGIPRVEYRYPSLGHTKRGGWKGWKGVQAKELAGAVKKLAAARRAGLGPAKGQGQQKHGIFMFTMAQEAISTRAKCRNGKIPFCWPKRAHHPFQSEDEKKGRKKRIPRANMDAFQSKPVAIGGWSMTRPCCLARECEGAEKRERDKTREKGSPPRQ